MTIRKHQRKFRNMHDIIDLERQRSVELLQALNDKDMWSQLSSKATKAQLVRLFNIASQLPTAQQRHDKEVQDELQSCGHCDAGAVGLTAFDVLLCEVCHQKALSGRMVHWHVLDCAHCDKVCALLPLPKQLTRPWKQEVVKATEIVAMVRDGLRQLIGGPSATMSESVEADMSSMSEARYCATRYV